MNEIVIGVEKQADLALAIEEHLKEMYELGEATLGSTLGENGPLVRDVAWVTAGAALRHLELQRK